MPLFFIYLFFIQRLSYISLAESPGISVQSSLMGPPHPLTRRQVLLPPLWILRGGDTLACGEEVGTPNSDDWPENMVL
jgi:hypothetical protein